MAENFTALYFNHKDCKEDMQTFLLLYMYTHKVLQLLFFIFLCSIFFTLTYAASTENCQRRDAAADQKYFDAQV